MSESHMHVLYTFGTLVWVYILFKCRCRSQGLHLPRYPTFYSIHWYNVVGVFFNFSPIRIKMICHQHLEHLFLKSTSMGERAVNQIPRAWLPPRSQGYSWWGFGGMDTCILTKVCLKLLFPSLFKWRFVYNEIKHICQLSTIENDKRENICNGIREIYYRGPDNLRSSSDSDSTSVISSSDESLTDSSLGSSSSNSRSGIKTFLLWRLRQECTLS